MAATTAPHRNALPGTLLLVAWFALASGLAEGIFRWFQKLVLGKLILMSPHVIWMAPVADLLWIGAPALLLVLVRAVRPSLVPAGLLVGVLAAAAFLPLVLLYTSMHKVVALFLAGALGFQASRMIMARPEGFGRLVRRSVLPLAVLALLGGVAVAGYRMMRERQALAALPEPKAGMPNVLLIIWDTVRGQSLSAYGYERPTTPYLAEFAKEGARFDLAMTTAPWTLPSHGAMFTGHRPLDLMQSIYLPIVDTVPNLAAVLAANGYRTAGFVANMAYTTAEHGLARGFSRYEDYKIGPGNIILASRLGRVLSDMNRVRTLTGYWEQLGRKDAGEISRRFLDWAGDGDRPFFAFLNYFDAHQPYIAPAPYRSRFVRDSTGGFHPHFFHIKARDLSAREIAWLKDNYDATIAYLDDDLKALMGELERRGVLDNTIVIISSDHGEHLGDHRRVGHMNSLYRTLLQVPLVIRYPAKITPGTVVGTPVSIRDFPQTVLDLAGVADTVGFPGRTLARFWNGTPADSAADVEPVFGEIATRRGRGPFSLYLGDYHYIAWQGQDRPSELYHLHDDPWETVKLTDSVTYGPVLAELRRWSAHYMGEDALKKRAAPGGDDEEENLPQ